MHMSKVTKVMSTPSSQESHN